MQKNDSKKYLLVNKYLTSSNTKYVYMYIHAYGVMEQVQRAAYAYPARDCATGCQACDVVIRPVAETQSHGWL